MSSVAVKTPAPKRKFSQNFLTNPHYVRKIVDAANLSSGDTAVEIGCGKGALTELLLESGATLHGVEIDPDMIRILTERFSQHPRFTLHHQDILTFDFHGMASGFPLTVIGNLPYHISSPILFHLMESGPIIRQALIMVQKEVAERIVGKPHSKDYGILSIFCQYHAACEKLFDLPPGAFFPAPKVTSSIVRMTFHRDMTPWPHYPLFVKIVKAGFNQRRKMLRNSLSSFEGINNVTIDLSQRPENLSVEDFIRLTDELAMHQRHYAA